MILASNDYEKKIIEMTLLLGCIPIHNAALTLPCAPISITVVHFSSSLKAQTLSPLFLSILLACYDACPLA